MGNTAERARLLVDEPTNRKTNELESSRRIEYRQTWARVPVRKVECQMSIDGGRPGEATTPESKMTLVVSGETKTDAGEETTQRPEMTFAVLGETKMVPGEKRKKLWGMSQLRSGARGAGRDGRWTMSEGYATHVGPDDTTTPESDTTVNGAGRYEDGNSRNPKRLSRNQKRRLGRLARRSVRDVWRR